MSAATAALVQRPTGVAILGCGYWGVNYLRVFSELPDAEVVVACDHNAKRLDEIRHRFGRITMTTDIDEALSTPGVEAVVIATEASTHYDLARKVLLLGKDALVEKPLALEVGEAQELADLAEARGRVLLVGHTFLYNTGIRRVKEYLTSGEIGSTYYAYARRTSLGPIRSDVNAIWDLAAHDVAIFNYLLDAQPEWVSAVGARVLCNSREDVGFISLSYPNGVVGHIHVSWADPHKVRQVVVVGSDKRIVFDDLDPTERVRVFDKGVKAVDNPSPIGFAEHHFQMRDGGITSPPVPFIEPLKHQCGHFLHVIRRGERLHTDGRQGRDVVAVMKAIEASVARSGAPVVVGLAAVGNGGTPHTLEHALQNGVRATLQGEPLAAHR
jgi:predicted dehydrogenase